MMEESQSLFSYRSMDFFSSRGEDSSEMGLSGELNCFNLDEKESWGFDEVPTGWLNKKKEAKEPPRLPQNIIIYLPETEEKKPEEGGGEALRNTEAETMHQWLINNTIDSIIALALPSLLMATAYTLGKKSSIGTSGGYLGMLALISVVNLKSARDRVEPYVLKGAYAVARAVSNS